MKYNILNDDDDIIDTLIAKDWQEAWQDLSVKYKGESVFLQLEEVS